MKNKIWIILAAACLILSGCNKEEDLTPSLADMNYADSLDLTNPLVKEYYEKYKVGLLTRFNLTTDLLYNMTTSDIQEEQWNTLQVSKLERLTEIDSAYQFVNETLLQYFTDDEFKKKYFPKRILLGREVFLANSYNNICTLCTESDARVSEQAINSLHSVFSPISFALSCKLDAIYYSEENYNGYKMDNLYMFICYLFEHNNLYDELEKDFYPIEMENCYGRPLTGDESSWLGLGVYVEEGGSPDDQYTSKYWYWNHGFVSTRNCIPVMTTPEGEEDVIRLKTWADGISDKDVFPDRNRDVRNVINQMLFVTQEVFDSYPAIIKDRFSIIMNKFDEWGIDIRSINPTMEHAFPRK